MKTGAAKIQAAAVILAGGRSTRMGRDKAVLRVSGERLIDHAIHFLRPLFPEILVAVGTRRLKLPRGARAVRDRFSGPDRRGAGPTAGIDAAFSATRRRFLFVMACDMPAASSALVRLLWDAARRGRGAVPEGPGGTEPLFGFYRRDAACALERLLRAGQDIPVRRLARLSGARRIPWETVRRADPCGISFMNLNRPGDIARFRREPDRVTVSGERRCDMGSLIKKRRKKMNKHKYKKMRKRLAFLRK